jgi:hypothetical protein
MPLVKLRVPGGTQYWPAGHSQLPQHLAPLGSYACPLLQQAWPGCSIPQSQAPVTQVLPG